MKNINQWITEAGFGTTGKTIKIAVIDSGCSFHPDLDGCFIGWKDFVHRKAFMYDDYGHGTHIAGIIHSIAPDSGLLILKILDENGKGTLRDYISALKYIYKYRKTFSIRIVNISIAAYPKVEQTSVNEMLDWIERLWEAGILLVTSAGNHGPEKNSVPVSGISPYTITVGSYDQIHKQISSFSGRGDHTSYVVKPDVCAPGSRIWSCHHLYPARSHRPYVEKSGTSMSTAIVTGICALMMEENQHLTNEEIRKQLWKCCDKVPRETDSQGHGCINPKKIKMSRKNT